MEGWRAAAPKRRRKMRGERARQSTWMRFSAVPASVSVFGHEAAGAARAPPGCRQSLAESLPPPGHHPLR